MSLPRPLSSLPLLVALVACEADTPVSTVEIEVQASALLPNVVTVSWTTPEPASTQVEWGRLNADEESTPLDSTLSTEHHQLVMGIPVEGSVMLRAVSVGADGTRYESTAAALTIEAPNPPLPTIELSTPSDDLSGYILMSVGTGDEYYALIVNRHGEVVWWAPAPVGELSTSSTISHDGRAVVYGSHGKDMLGTAGAVWRRELDGSGESFTPTPGQHHDFVEMPDGSVAYLGVEVREFEGNQVMGDTILRAEPDGSFSTVFSAWNELSPYAMCEHFQSVNYASGAWDWVHANSLRYDENDDAFWLMSRNLDALFSISASDGSIRYQFGGVDSDFALESGEAFDHAHFSHAWSGGVVLFDNGLHREPAESRVVEYRLDHDTMVATEEWSLDRGICDDSLGDVRALESSYLVSWSTEGKVAEVDAGGATRWEIAFPTDYRVGHVNSLSSLYAP